MKWYVKIGSIIGILLFCVLFVYGYSEFNDVVIHRWANITNLNVTENISAGEYRNSSFDLDWIGPANIFDVDDEDIEGDLNTYVDIAGDTMTGPLNTTILNASTIYAENGTFVGNVTAENIFLPAFTFAHTEVTMPIKNVGTWVNISFNSTVTVKPRITHNVDAINHTFIIVDPGWYDIHYTMVFADSQATPLNHIVMRVTLNGKEIDGSLLEEDSTKQYSEFSISNGPIIQAQTGDTIGFQFTADSTTISLSAHKTYGDHRDSAVIKIKKIANYNT